MDDPKGQAQNDPILQRYLSSASADERQAALEELLVERADPLISRVLRSAFRVTLNTDQFTSENQDALELAGDIKAKLLLGLTKLAADSSDRTISHFDGYVVTVAQNSFRQHLRSKYPWHRQLRRTLLYLLEHHPDLSVWSGADNEDHYCGFKRAESKSISAMGTESIMVHLRPLVKERGLDRQDQTVSLVREIFKIVKAGIPFEVLLKVVYEAQGLGHLYGVVSLDEETMEQQLPATLNETVTKLEMRAELSLIWSEVLQMSRRHRAAILLNLRDAHGDSMIRLIPILSIASMRQIAKCLEISLEELAGIWNELPWDDNQIADLLGIERQQVINLRSSARLRLRRRLAYQ